MTLISFATYGTDRIEFITDSVSYTKRVSELGRCTKHLTMPHLDAAVMTQGNSNFGVAAKTAMLLTSGGVATFDELVDQAPELLRVMHASGIELGDTPADDLSLVFLMGWSDRDGRFRAYEMARQNDFEPSRIVGLYITPSPWRIRPSRSELERFRHYMSDCEDLDKLVDAWQSWPAQPAPRSVGEWVDLAKTVREQRTLDKFFQTVVAGDVFHTVMRRGSVETRKVHTFNDSGDELLKIVESTEHPLGLAQACYCESGKTYGECCVEKWRDCQCGSGKPFGECCLGSTAARVPARGVRGSAADSQRADARRV